MLYISRNVSLPDNEIEISAIRSQGVGGQNVNKVASAIHLRFDIRASSLPDFYKQRLLKLHDRRITTDGVVVIKAQQYRSQDKNRHAAFMRLQELIQSVAIVRRPRKTTRVPKHVKAERLDQKRKRGDTKTLRGKISFD
ncbi:MAG: aminoacyl-tRNA hydrolase [Gammaproteobacteria bacterium]|nr:aminoacyl-tRNA hydrolase [Gammaproteobacteria bacterium]